MHETIKRENVEQVKCSKPRYYKIIINDFLRTVLTFSLNIEYFEYSVTTIFNLST